jgi:hypothetical protein
MSFMILSLLPPAGNSLFPGTPIPGAWPPPVASPSRICVVAFWSDLLPVFRARVYMKMAEFGEEGA